MNLMEAVELYESGEMDWDDEALEMARWLVTSGLVNSTGSMQRFVESVIDHFSPENFYMDGELFG